MTSGSKLQAPGGNAARRWLQLFPVAISAGSGIASGQWLAATATGQTPTAEVRASINRGSVFRLYYTNIWSEPQTAAIVPGKWTVYQFTVPSRLTALRFDPSDEAGAEAMVNEVTIRSPRSSISLSTERLQEWLLNELDVNYDARTSIARLAVRRRGGYMMGGADVDIAVQSRGYSSSSG